MSEIGRKLASPWVLGLLADRPSTLSAAMHNAGFAALSRPYRFTAIDTIQTAEALQAMRVLGIRGFALTIPHKERAMSLVDVLSPEATVTGSINTVVNDGSKLTGYNTDIAGVEQALCESKVPENISSALVLGAGGASRAAVVALRNVGVTNIALSNRSEGRGRALASELQTEFLPWAGLGRANDFGLVINATPIGSHLSDETSESELLGILNLAGVFAVLDMVTKPTALLDQARESGCVAIAGARMLLFQAFAQFALFTGEAPPRDAMEKALYQALAV